jgi:hypothetical protein
VRVAFNLKSAGGIRAAIEKSSKDNYYCLSGDLVRAMASLGGSSSNALYVQNVITGSLEFRHLEADLCNVTFFNCYFQEIYISPNVDTGRLPKFSQCMIGELDSWYSATEIFDSECIIEKHISGEVRTTSNLRKLELGPGVRVLLDTLEKIFVQSTQGRKERALYGGLDTRSRQLVPEVLAIIQRAGFVTSVRREAETIWLPELRFRTRVASILSDPFDSVDPVVKLAAELE